MSLDKKITDFLDDQIPDYVQEYYPIFVIFVTKYYEWLEQGGNPQEIIQNIKLNADIDTTATSLATKFVNTYAPNLPQTSALDRAVLVKHFRDFYRSKGSVKSFEFFFRAFFNDTITVKLPGDSLFRTSHGDWYIEKTLRVQAVTGNPKNLEHTTVQGTSSFATAIIEHAVENYGLWDLTVQNRSLSGTFNSSETIVGTYWTHTATTSISSQIVVQNTATVNVAPGRQRGTDSQLSADQFIQDSVYWQRFSYVIRTRITLDRWQDAILEQLHPSGRSLFGEIVLDSDTSVSVTAVATTFAQSNAINTEVKFSSSDDFIIQTGYTFDRLANYRTGTSETTSIGGVSYAADYTYGGENITFALQNAADNIRSYAETFTYTSLTGTIGVAATTGVTASNRDFVSYTIPVTSITGTVNGVAQPSGGEMVLTGNSTVFTTELPLDNIWRYTSGTDGSGNPVYEYYSSVLTIENLAVTGTVTLAVQTPQAPNYYYYASGTNTKFLSDLLVTGGDTSTGISNETIYPRIFPGERQPQVIINSIPLAPSSNVVYVSGTTAISDANGAFLSQLFVGGEITTIKQLSGRLIQVSSLPAIASSWAVTLTRSTSSSYSIIGSSLTTVSSVGSSRSQHSSLTTTTDPAMWSRWDVPVPFPVYFLDTSTTTLYIHSTGMIAFDTSYAAHSNGSDSTYDLSVTSFQPAVPKIYVNPYWSNKLKNVYYQSFGSTPNRYFKVYYDGWYDYPYEGDWTAYGVSALGAGPNAVRGQNFNTLTTGATLTVSTTPTSGTVSNGYWQLTLPWSFNFFNTSYNQIYVSHHGRVSLGDWKDGSGYTITTNVTTSNGLLYSQPVLPRIEPMYVAESQPDGAEASPWQIVQNNPRFGNRVYYGVSAGSAATTSRVFTIRWEGGFYSTAPNDRTMAWEISFNEAYLSSVTLHGAITPYQSQFNLASWNFVNVPLWKVGLNGAAYQESVYYGLWLNYSSSGTYAATQNSTSEQISFSTGADDIFDYVGNRQQWEATFYENSSNGIAIKRVLSSSFYGNPQFDEFPRINSLRRYFLYQTDAQLNLISASADAASQIGDAALVSTYTPLPAVSSIQSILGISSSTSILFKLATGQSLIGERSSHYTNNTFPWSSNNIALGSLLTAVTGSGVVARWPQDGYTAAAGNGNPNPTCSAVCISSTYHPGGIIYINGFPRVSKFRFQSLPASTSVEGDSTSAAGTYQMRGYLFSYGSSVATHGRWLMTTPTYGTFHHIRVNGYINVSSSSFVYDLRPLSSGQDLELWYSTAENPQPPAPGQSPSTAGWTKRSTIWSGSNKYTAGYGDGLMFNQGLTYADPMYAIRSYSTTTGASSNGGNFYLGKTGYYSGSTWFNNSGYEAFEKPFKCTWLIYQASYTAQSTPDQRTSEYLLTEVSTASSPTGYIIGYTGYLINPDSVVTEATGNYNSGSMIRLRDEIGSGSVIRIAHPADRQGNTVNIDYVVSQDPQSRALEGDYTLVLRTTTSTTNTSFTNIWDGNSGGYFKGAAGVPAYSVETRTVTSIESNTSATVNAAFTSTSLRYWGNNTSSSSTSARAFNLIAVNSDTSITLAATAGDSSAAIAAASTNLSMTADRRFILTGINTDTNITVSGGGVYANFAGKTATFAKLQSGIAPGFIISGYHDASLLTSDTTWVINGIPGIDILGSSKGNVAGTRLEIGNSSFTVVEVYSDTSILVTGNAILKNFYDTSLTMYFPSYSSNISVTGISTKFLPQITTATTTSAGLSIEEVTETGRAPDFRYGFLQIGNTSFTITSIVNDTSLIVAGGPVTETTSGAIAYSYQYRRDYPLPRVIGAPDSASFDKAGSTIGVDDTLITQGNSVDFTNFRTLYHSSSYTLSLTANTVIVSTSITVNATGNAVLLVTWMKDFTANAAEGNNRLHITVSSSGTFQTLFDNEIQQNYKEVSIGQTLLYANTFYVNSSNSISSVNAVVNGATTSTATWNWIPFNINRSGVYSRFSTRLEAFADTSLTISVQVPAGYQWESTTSDFVNITVVGVA